MSKVTFVSPLNSANALLSHAMVKRKYNATTDTLTVIDCSSKGDLDANIAAVAANQDVIIVACNVSDTDSGLTVAQNAALQLKLKAVTGVAVNWAISDQSAVRNTAWYAYEFCFGSVTGKPYAVYLISQLMGDLTPTEIVQGDYLKLSIKARYFGNLGTDTIYQECLGLIDLGLKDDTVYRPAYNNAGQPKADMLLLTDLLNEGLAIENYGDSLSGSIYINRFTIDADGETWIGTIDDNAGTIDIALPYGEAVIALVPDFVASDGAKVYVGEEEQVSGVTPINLTTPKTYSVLAAAGGIKQYANSVTLNGGSAENDILTFSFPEQTGAATIDLVAHTIAIECANGTDLTALIPTFTTSPKIYSIKIGAVLQVSNVTKNSYAAPVVYDIISQNGTAVAFTVTATEAAP